TNLYVHFPFCRRKCSYCALYSKTGVSQAERDAYVRRLAAEIEQSNNLKSNNLATVYFGGGSPALCDLSVLAPALRPLCGEDTEFTVELHPLDVTEAKLDELRMLGVNRISMGVQSLNDATLADMGRGYAVDEAEQAFALVKRFFDNAGIDLVVGYPGDELGEKVEKRGGGGQWNLQRLRSWGLKHCSVYSLQNERGLKNLPDDDAVLDRIRTIAAFLKELGLERYEISNYAVPDYECRHNLAVWRGEDYVGLGDGACGRIGLKRTKFGKEDTVSSDFDEKERRLFRLRTREGLDASNHPEWGQTLQNACKQGLLTQSGSICRLTDRGMEVCDSILAELV
ncbi:MAG: coproporphyrinogen III oxidase family protein, partial [bacterium]|nr:coproporphyrinogen III oxidase family protein [Candidatus Colisoma equi]